MHLLRRAFAMLVTLSVLGCRCACPPELAATVPASRSPPGALRVEPVSGPKSGEASARAAPSAAAAARPSPSDDEASPAASMTDEERALHDEFDGAPALSTSVGRAAYYSDALAGRKTASGEPYDPQRFMAAHRSLPFGTVVRVIRVDRGLSTYVRIKDRGPFGDSGRIIDLSKIAARRLDMIRDGVVKIRLEVVKKGEK